MSIFLIKHGIAFSEITRYIKPTKEPFGRSNCTKSKWINSRRWSLTLHRLFYVGTDYFILLTFSMTIHFMIIYVSS